MEISLVGGFEHVKPLSKFRLLPVVIVLFFIEGSGGALAFGAVRPDVQELLDCLASDGNSDATDARVRKELSTRQDIKPDLFAALDRDYFHGTDDGETSHTSALAALQYRKDLTPRELGIITDEINKWAGRTTGRSHHNGAFVMAGIAVLKNYPSKENEGLVLMFVGDKDGGICDSLIETLGVIGTQGSRQALQEWRKELEKKNPHYTIIKQINASIAAIEARISASNPAQQTPTEPDRYKKQQSQQHEANDKSDIQVAQSNTFQSILLWLVLLLSATCGAVWLFLRKFLK